MQAPRRNLADGFTLIEVVIAMAVLTIAMTAVVSAATVASVSAARSREHSMATWLALERLEQLRGLAWGSGQGTVPLGVADFTTDLSTSPPGMGGPGLSVSSPDALASSMAGLADYLDGDGQWVGSGVLAPKTAVFVRRWRVSSVPASRHALVLEVFVSRIGVDGVAHGRPDDVRLVTIKTRKAA